MIGKRGGDVCGMVTVMVIKEGERESVCEYGDEEEKGVLEGDY